MNKKIASHVEETRKAAEHWKLRLEKEMKEALSEVDRLRVQAEIEKQNQIRPDMKWFKG